MIAPLRSLDECSLVHDGPRSRRDRAAALRMVWRSRLANRSPAGITAPAVPTAATFTRSAGLTAGPATPRLSSRPLRGMREAAHGMEGSQ
jgi:hypothetical protein